MQQIEVLYAEVICDGRRYIYSPNGKPTAVKTGGPYCDRSDVVVEMLTTLDASHLYSVEEQECAMDALPNETIV